MQQKNSPISRFPSFQRKENLMGNSFVITVCQLKIKHLITQASAPIKETCDRE